MDWDDILEAFVGTLLAGVVLLLVVLPLARRWGVLEERRRWL